MDINAQIQANTNSVKQALNVSLLQKSMNKDAQSVTALLQGMEQSIVQVQSAGESLGKNIDVRV